MLVYDVMFDVVLLGDTANTSLTEDSMGGGLLSVRDDGVCWVSSGWTVWGEEEGGATVSKRRWCVLVV